MAIITISRGSYSRGRMIAEKLADKLGYECISREVLIEASQEFNVPEIKLIRAIHDAPSILDRFTHGREKYVAFIRAALLEKVRHDKVVYHGHAGHFFLMGISHVMKVRIIANIEDRIKEEMRRENMSAEEARKILVQDDNERRKWALTLYGIDTWDARLYDIVLHIDTMSVDDAVALLVHAASLPCFQPTAESMTAVTDLYLAAKAEAILVDKFPGVKVTSSGGRLQIKIEAPGSHRRRLTSEIRGLLAEVDGVKEVDLQVEPIIIPA